MQFPFRLYKTAIINDFMQRKNISRGKNEGKIKERKSYNNKKKIKQHSEIYLCWVIIFVFLQFL